MRLCVFGASGRTGSAFFKRALERGHSVTAFYRSDSRAVPPPDIKIVWGDLFCRGHIERAVQDTDAVVDLYALRWPSAHALFASVIADIIEAMKIGGVKRLLYVTDTMTGRGSLRRSLSAKAMNRIFEMKHPAIAGDRANQEQFVETSGLEWTIIITPRLTAGPRTGRYRIGTGLKAAAFSRISRDDLSTVILDQVDSNDFAGKRVVVRRSLNRDVHI